MTKVVVFAPSPLLTVTVEENGETPELHLHAGGQGVWQARMLARMGVDVVVCCALLGESGGVVRHLLEKEGIPISAIDAEGRGGGYVHDRRDGERHPIIEIDGDPLERHDLDELYGLVLKEALDANAVILSGPAGETALPADVYRRLASDLREAGAIVVVDLAGERLAASIEGGVDLVKVSDEELVADGRAQQDDDQAIIDAMRKIASDGARTVIVTRAPEPFLVLHDDEVHAVTGPHFETADPRGAGDSLTAGVTAALAQGKPIQDAVRLGAAAGALNVTRHGLGTGDPEAIDKLRELVTVAPVRSREDAARLSPDDLAKGATESEDDEEGDTDENSDTEASAGKDT